MSDDIIDDTARKKIWNSKIPISLRLAEVDRHRFNVPERILPYYASALRGAYLPMILESFLQYLYTVAPMLSIVSKADIWFECNNTSVKWYLPVGLLYDMMKLKNQNLVTFSMDVRFSDFPEKQLVRCASLTDVRQQFAMALKEADCLKHGSTKKIMDLSKNDQEALFDALMTDDAHRYRLVSDRLWKPFHAIQSIPVRVYDADAQYQYRISPFLSASTSHDRPLTTVADLLTQWKLPQRSVHLHGIVIPHATPLLWLAINFSYPDHFLYLVLGQ